MRLSLLWYTIFSISDSGSRAVAENKAARSCGEYFQDTPPLVHMSCTRLDKLLPNSGWEKGRLDVVPGSTQFKRDVAFIN